MMRASRRRARGLGILLALVGGLGLAVGGPARAQETSNTFFGVANAEGVRVYYELAEFLVVEELVDVGVPAAQALVSDIDSVGYAAAPHPGQAALAAPGLAGGSVGQPLPSYPAYAKSSASGPPDAEVNQPPLSLRATSTSDASTAMASVGAAPEGPVVVAATLASAEVSHDPDDGTTVSMAESRVEGLVISDVLRFGRVRASAKVTAPPGQERVVESSFEMDGVTVAGVGVGVTDNGLVLAGSSTALPDSGPIADILREASIDVKYLAPEVSEDGVVSAGLQITLMDVAVPGAPTPGDVIIQLGRASARATGGIEEAGEEAGFILDEPSGVEVPPPDSTGPLGATDHGSAASPPPTDATGQPPTDATGQPPAPTVQSSSSAALAAAPRAVVPPAIGWFFYPVLVLGGLVVVGASQLIRFFGVRLAWTT